MAWDIEPGWIIGAFSGMFAALSGVVIWIGHHLTKQINRQNNRLDKCEEKHDRQHQEAKVNAQQMGELKGELAAIKTYAGPEMAKTIAKIIVEAIK